MNIKNKSIVKDLKQLLSNYLTKASAKDFMKILDEDISIKHEQQPEIPESEKLQIEYELPKGINYRIPVDKVITYCAKLLSEENYFNLILDLSQLMFFSGEISYSLEIAEDLLNKIHTNGKHANIQAETILMISKIYWSQAHWDECSYYIDEAMSIFKSIKSEPGIAKCENMLGTLYGEKGDFDKAQKHLKNALNHLSDEDDLSARAMILTNLGIISTIKGDYEKAVWNYKNAEVKFNQLNDVRRLARVYHNTGMLYTRMESYDAALDEFNKCITLSLENDYLSNCAVAYIGKAYIYTKLKNPALADAYTDKAMEIAYQLNDTLSIADIYKVKGMIQNDMSNFELSEELFENSIRLNKDMESKLNEAESSVQLGELLEKSNRINEAKPYLKSATNFFNRLNHEKIKAGLVEQSI
jgi:tetratricopeptide (TPR) repeat protein